MEKNGLSSLGIIFMQCSAAIRGWVKQSLNIDMRCIEELSSGAIYCQLLDMIYENVVPLKDVVFATNRITIFRKNFIVLQKCLEQLEIPIEVPIEDLVWCDFEANLAFAVEFFKIFRTLSSSCEKRMLTYKALTARNYQKFSMDPPTLVSRGTEIPNLEELEKNFTS
ncbi:microtubule-associated protein RP/EB family member 1-like [Drosophila eugracilis]|uniref:microtubule-associated protein RP/EB family member 1-like n=1 Tax=Drosophila eugracilis TaxID=29029 RepID=UPI0007E61E40|nr:microtubule-associated protein RP/EB family member 1-like [Drosophila eugracilis]